MSSKSGRCNSAERGSSYDRRSRKLWLLSPESGHGGDGTTAPCWECGTRVDYGTLIVDRIIAGAGGGRYTRDNIRAHCALCSCRQGQCMTVAIVQAKRIASARLLAGVA